VPHRGAPTMNTKLSKSPARTADALGIAGDD
jgi:hypothetical protein